MKQKDKNPDKGQPKKPVGALSVTDIGREKYSVNGKRSK